MWSHVERSSLSTAASASSNVPWSRRYLSPTSSNTRSNRSLSSNNCRTRSDILVLYDQGLPTPPLGLVARATKSTGGRFRS